MKDHFSKMGHYWNYLCILEIKVVMHILKHPLLTFTTGRQNRFDYLCYFRAGRVTGCNQTRNLIGSKAKPNHDWAIQMCDKINASINQLVKLSWGWISNNSDRSTKLRNKHLVSIHISPVAFACVRCFTFESLKQQNKYHLLNVCLFSIWS